MRAIEINSQTNNAGYLDIHYALHSKNKKVKVIVLIEEENLNEEELWLKSIASNPAFEFLNNEEDIYKITDGEEFN